MKLVISQKQNVQKFVDIFKLLKGFCSDINLVFQSDNDVTTIMDQGHISLCELGIHASWFDTCKIVIQNTFSVLTPEFSYDS